MTMEEAQEGNPSTTNLIFAFVCITDIKHSLAKANHMTNLNINRDE